MNKIKLIYIRWKNTSKWIKKRKLRKMTLEKVFYSLKETNTYRGWLHNFFVIYKSFKKYPDLENFMKIHLLNTYLHLHHIKGLWKFAKSVYKEQQKWLKENTKNRK